MPIPTAPGWYPDPSGIPTLRWFDGSQWTDELAPLPPGAQVAPVEKPWWQVEVPLTAQIILWTLGIVIVLAVMAGTYR